MIPALLLTAGLGARLDPLTRLVAKPAVPLAGRPLVEHILVWLGAQGVRDVVLNLHHLPASLTTIVGDGAHLDLRVRYSWEDPILGSAGGPRRALPLLDSDPFLIVNGDTLCAFDLAPLFEAHAARGADVTLTVVPNPAPDHYNGVVLDAEDRVVGFVPKGQAAGSWHFVGVQVASAAVFRPLADGVPAETVAGLYRDRLAEGWTGLHAWRAPTPVLDVGTPADYLAAALQMAGGSGRQFNNVAASARVVNSVVWPEAHVAAGADLEDCIVAGPVRVPAGFTARRAVIAPAAIARPGDRAKIVGDVAVFGM